ncbi:MAG TPA: penicillin-binding transpeptidase domain-containing protein, partial [Gemmatimonadales bacterium]|nr:penicillin-binding transpeptidase domain-containing protein [Gemmatimonadales bacterium]
EFTASSLQIATAYAAIANGGTLLAPTLVREVRTWPEGEVIWRHRPDTVRTVLEPETASRLMEFLRLATDEGGTGGRAQLDRWEVIGKTGTAKLVPGVREYRGAFAGIFPGESPRFVVYVMIDRPGGAEYYGGLVAAPIVRNLLIQALALPDSPLDPEPAERSGPLPGPRRVQVAEAPVEVRRLSWPLPPEHGGGTRQVAVPAVTGWRAREAVRQLHGAGLQVRLLGTGLVVSSEPAPGDTVATGSTVTLIAESSR